MRPCAMGHSWKKELHADTRLLHPMKRVGEKGPGRGLLRPDHLGESADTIAEKMVEIKEKYGPYGIFHSQYPSFEKNGFLLAPGGRPASALRASTPRPGHAAARCCTSALTSPRSPKASEPMPGFEAPDFFNSKLFVMWGHGSGGGLVRADVLVLHAAGPRVRMKTIVIDPRYTQSAEILADQWIPIRPGTDWP